MGGKADAVVHVGLGDKEFKTKVTLCEAYLPLLNCKVAKENNNPQINETFRFPLPTGEKTRHTLYFQV